MPPSLEQQLTDLLGSDAAVSSDRLAEFAVDGVTPQAVVQPANREAVAEVLRWASSEGLAVVPRGGGTQMCLGNPPRRVDLVLDLSKLDRVLDFQPADLTVTVETGATLAQLQQRLAAEGKLVPLEAPLSHRATIGGILAANASGPLRAGYGLTRDWLIGIAVVGAQGVETKAGGRVVKNVTGYDLNKLYTGSLGTLGVIVEASFKLAPRPTTWGCLVAAYPSVADALAGARALRGQVHAPQAIQVVNGPVAGWLSSHLGSMGGTGSPAQSLALAFYYGRAQGVGISMEAGGRTLRDSPIRKVERLGGDETAALLRSLTDLGWTKDTAPHLALKLSLPPSAVAEASTAFWEDDFLGAPPGVVSDAGLGGLRLLWWREGGQDSAKPDGEAGEAAALKTIRRAREVAARLGGSAVVEQCPLGVKQQVDVWGDSFEGLEIMRQIKNRFDPLGTLNPGRFVGGL